MLVTGASVLEGFLAFKADDSAGLEPVAEVLASLKHHVDPEIPAGVRVLRHDQIHAVSKVDYAAYARARHSVRQFAEGPTPDTEIWRAAEAAQAAPSNCNRQTCHVHAFTDPGQIDRVRKH